MLRYDMTQDVSGEYHVTPQDGWGECHVTQQDGWGEYHVIPQDGWGDYHVIPQDGWGEYHVTPQDGWGEYHVIPRNVSGEHHVTQQDGWGECHVIQQDGWGEYRVRPNVRGSRRDSSYPEHLMLVRPSGCSVRQDREALDDKIRNLGKDRTVNLTVMCDKKGSTRKPLASCFFVVDCLLHLAHHRNNFNNCHSRKKQHLVKNYETSVERILF